jgi:beta,beta-carotene 9',10'-dioxygenase
MVKNFFELGFGKTTSEIQVEHLTIQGKFPAWLQGSLIRNGPGIFHIGQESYRHWFDGLPMLHKFTFTDGRIAYANKFLDTLATVPPWTRGVLSFSEFATDPQWSLLDRIKNVFNTNITDSAKVNMC